MRQKESRWLILAIGTMGMFFTGMIYTWSIIKVPFETFFGWNPSQLALNFTISMISFCLGSMLAGTLYRRISLRVLLSAAAILGLIGFYRVSNLTGDSIVSLYIFYGIFAGSSTGIAYNVILSVINAWFTDKKGTASGILMMSFGGSALVLGTLANRLIGSEAFGWRFAYRLFALCFAVSLLLSAAFLKKRPEKDILSTEGTNKRLANKLQSETGLELTTLEMIKRPEFWKFFLFLVTASSIGNTTVSITRDLSIEAGAEAALASFLVGLFSICNGSGRLIAGMIYDKRGRKICMLIDGVLTTTAPLLILLALNIHSLIICIAGIIAAGFSYSFQPPITSSVVAAFYGNKYYSSNYSIGNLNIIPASVIATISGILISNTGSFIASYVMLLVLSVISFILNRSISKS